MSKAKEIPCSDCGSLPVLRGSDDQDTEGPFCIQCSYCGKETVIWVYPREAWAQWKFDNIVLY